MKSLDNWDLPCGGGWRKEDCDVEIVKGHAAITETSVLGIKELYLGGNPGEFSGTNAMKMDSVDSTRTSPFDGTSVMGRGQSAFGSCWRSHRSAPMTTLQCQEFRPPARLGTNGCLAGLSVARWSSLPSTKAVIPMGGLCDHVAAASHMRCQDSVVANCSSGGK